MVYKHEIEGNTTLLNLDFIYSDIRLRYGVATRDSVLIFEKFGHFFSCIVRKLF